MKYLLQLWDLLRRRSQHDHVFGTFGHHLRPQAFIPQLAFRNQTAQVGITVFIFREAE